MPWTHALHPRLIQRHSNDSWHVPNRCERINTVIAFCFHFFRLGRGVVCRRRSYQIGLTLWFNLWIEIRLADFLLIVFCQCHPKARSNQVIFFFFFSFFFSSSSVWFHETNWCQPYSNSAKPPSSHPTIKPWRISKAHKIRRCCSTTSVCTICFL